jgi:hypothetical protein
VFVLEHGSLIMQSLGRKELRGGATDSVESRTASALFRGWLTALWVFVLFSFVLGCGGDEEERRTQNKGRQAGKQADDHPSGQLCNKVQ